MTHRQWAILQSALVQYRTEAGWTAAGDRPHAWLYGDDEDGPEPTEGEIDELAELVGRMEAK